MASRRTAPATRRLAPGRRRPQRDGRAAAARPAARARRTGRRTARRRGARRHRRPARPALRVLPPGARAGGSAGADPARGRRPHHSPDRAGVPRPREHAGAAHRPRQAQDRRRPHRPHRARGGRADRAARRRAGRRLRDVQRGVRLLHRRHPGPRPRRRRRLAGAAWSRPRCPARRRRGAWPRSSPSSTRAAAPGSPTATSSCCATRTAPCGTRRRSPRASGSSSAPRRCGAPGPTSCRPRSPPSTRPGRAGRRRTGCRSRCCTTSWRGSTPPGRPAQPGRWPAPRSSAPADALAGLESLAEPLAGYHLFHATRAQLLSDLGRDDEAAQANRRALELTTNDAERRLLTTRLHRRPLDDGT